MPSLPLRKVCLVLTLTLAAMPEAGAGACDTAGLKGLDRGIEALRLNRPVPGRVISAFGMRKHPLLLIEGFHPGLDLAAASGDAVAAAAAGRVHHAGVDGDLGNSVRIDHGDGLLTVYAHLSRIEVRAGGCVARGQTIGHAGSTGLSAGPNLHFEVWLDGKLIDPGPPLGIKRGSE